MFTIYSPCIYIYIFIYIWCIVLFCSFFLIPIYLVAAPRVFAVAQIFPIFPRLETMAPEASSKPRVFPLKMVDLSIVT